MIRHFPLSRFPSQCFPSFLQKLLFESSLNVNFICFSYFRSMSKWENNFNSHFFRFFRFWLNYVSCIMNAWSDLFFLSGVKFILLDGINCTMFDLNNLQRTPSGRKIILHEITTRCVCSFIDVQCCCNSRKRKSLK